MSGTRKDKLVGSLLSLPTFNDENFNLLVDRQKIHINWLIENGMTEGNAVLLMAGGLGEGAFLNEREWNTLADVVVEAADGRVPTSMGVTDLSARAAAEKAKRAADLGIDFLQVNPPHYMGPTDDDVFGFYKYINDAADIGIIAYNLPWCMPNSFEFRQDLFERFADLENMDGLKWGSLSVFHWTSMIRLFKDRFNFIEQGGVFSVGYKLGMVGFIDTNGNVAPRYSLKKLELIREKRWEELDEMEIARLDADLKSARRADAAYPGMGEGPPARARLEIMGLDSGPYFPNQERESATFRESFRKNLDASGFMDWVDWDQSIFDEVKSEVAAAGAPAD